MPIGDRKAALNLICKWRNEKFKIVFTNGCFDILHRGHVEYLQEAKLLGDKLIIGLNSDESVSRIKGRPRPYQNEQDRSIILNALVAVDLVVIFEGDTPLNLICEIKPDVLVKGGDYDHSSIVGAQEVEDWDGQVKIITFKEGYGTSQLVNRIIEGRVL